MKKSILLLSITVIVIFLVVFSSVFLPRIKVEITIQPQYQSIAKGDKTDNVATDKPYCVVLSDLKTDKIANKINAYYEKGYRLKNFSATSSEIGIDTLVLFAAVCKE